LKSKFSENEKRGFKPQNTQFQIFGVLETLATARERSNR